MFTFNKENALEYMKYSIRSKRAKLFTELDTQFMRAIESGDDGLKNQIIDKKQVLRNLTDINIDEVTTREELIALWPEDILGPYPFPQN